MIETPIDLPCGVILKNRIVKSGLSEALGDLNNNPTNELTSIFKRWSDGGASLLITGNIIVDRWHLEHAGNFVLDGSTDIKKTSELCAAAKSGGLASDGLGSGSLKGQQVCAAVYQIADSVKYVGDDASTGGLNGMFHLHGFHNEQ